MYSLSSFLRSLICLGGIASTLGASEPALVQVSVPVLDHAISLDQGLNSDDWRQAAKVFGFSQLTDASKPASQETEVRFVSDQENLYIGVNCRQSPGAEARINFSANTLEPSVWKEDSVELFLAPEGKTGKDFFQFLLGVSGAYYQRLGGSTEKWNPAWERRVQSRDGSWLAIFKIPYKTLGMSQPPTALRFAIARSNYAPMPEMSRLIKTASNDSFIQSVEEMGVLRFNRESPVASVTARKDFSLGELVLFADAVRLPPDKFADSILEVLDVNGKIVAEDKQQSRFDSRTSIHRIADLADGLYTVRYRMQRATTARVAVYGADAGLAKLDGDALSESMTQWEWPIRVQAKLDVQAEVTLPDRAKRIRAEVSARGKAPAGSAPSLSFTLKDAQGNVVKELGSEPFSARAVFETELPELPERTDYYLQISVLNGQEVLAKADELVKIPPKPVWIDTKVGTSTEVPKPWSPVVLEGRKVSMWGREYTFATGPVPSLIVSQGRELLTDPSRLILDPAPKSWKLESANTEGTPARAAVLEWVSQGGAVTYKATTRVEFDGAIKIDVTVPGEAEVSKMAFEMSVEKDLAKYIHRGPLMWGSMNNSYTTPSTPEHYKILTVFHFLNDSSGMTWFDLMSFDWKLASPDRALEMIPGKDSTTLRVNYIDGPSNYPIARTFSFGLQALPARPMPETQSLLRWWTGVSYGDEDAKLRPAWLSDIEYWGEGNVSLAAGSAEMWVKPAYPSDDTERTERFLSIEHGKLFKFQLIRKNAADGLTVRLVGVGGQTDFSTKHDVPFDTWSHVAMTWTADTVKVFLGGKLIGEFPAEVSERFNVPVHRIYVGGDQVFVDGLKITTDDASGRFALGGPMQVDDQTLLCDNFDNITWINGRKATVPLRSAEKTEGGYLSPDAVIAEGKWGQSLAPLQVPVKSVIQGMADSGLSTIMYHALQYTDISCGGLYIANELAFRKLNDAAHEVGLKVCMYINNSLTNYDWMWQTYAKDWLIEPRDAPFIQAGIPNEHVYQVSPRSEYFEFFIWRISELQKEYGVDGFFLDGRMYCTSRNLNHEEGLKNFEGEDVNKRDMWDGRKRQMRVMNTIHENGGFYLQHKSGLWDAPAVFFNDGVWEGEQLMGTVRGNRKLTDILPIDAFRAQISGINFGMPSCYAAPPYSPLDPIEEVTYSFVHGTTPTPFYRVDEALVYRPFWKALDSFGATYQNFRGYWIDAPPAKSVPNPEFTKVSAHVKPGSALIMMSNFDTEPVKGDVVLDLNTLGLKNPKAFNALTGEVIGLNAGVISVDIKGMRSAWFLLEEEK